MNRLEEFRSHLKQGKVYRREDLYRWSASVDRHLALLLEEGFLTKLSQGLYYVPKESVFGRVPPDDEDLVSSFLKDKRFLIFSPNAYNTLGVGTTQLYNLTVVYNKKRHGIFKLGNREFDFRRKYDFPARLTPEFLFVDLINNLGDLAEDSNDILNNALAKYSQVQSPKWINAVNKYGNVKTKKLLLKSVESIA
ncbi:MAG: DUF6088 family protein [Chitinophagales bacterium]